MVNYCAKCGEKNLNNTSNYCRKCGSLLFNSGNTHQSKSLVIETINQSESSDQLEENITKPVAKYVKDITKVYIGLAVIIIGVAMELAIFLSNKLLSSFTILAIGPSIILSTVIISRGLTRKGNGLLLNIIGLIYILGTTSSFLSFQVIPEFVELKINVMIILIIIFSLVFNVPGVWILIEKKHRGLMLNIFGLIYILITVLTIFSYQELIPELVGLKINLSVIFTVIFSLVFNVPGILIVIKKKKHTGLILNIIGIIYILISILTISYTPTLPEFIELKINLSIIFTIIFSLVFNIPGILIKLEKNKNKFIVLIITVIYCSILSSMPLFLFFPIEWLDLSIFLCANLVVFWILLLIVPVSSLTTKSEKKYGAILVLDILALLTYVGMAIYIPLHSFFTAGAYPALTFRDDFFNIFWMSIPIGFLIGLGILFVIGSIFALIEEIIARI